MSHTTIHAVFKSKTSEIAELNNSWGSGPPLWNYINKKYFNSKFGQLQYPQEFWNAWKHLGFEFEKSTFMSTFDKCIININDLERFSIDCEKMHQAIIDSTDSTWNHWKNIGEVAKTLHKKHDKRCIGLAVGCTSVADPWWDYCAKDYENIYSIYEQIEHFSVPSCAAERS